MPSDSVFTVSIKDAVGSKLEPNPPADDAEVLISTILSNPESEMAQNLAKSKTFSVIFLTRVYIFLVLGGPQQEQLQQILAKMKHNEPESQNTEAIQDKSPLFDEIDRNNSWQEVS